MDSALLPAYASWAQQKSAVTINTLPQSAAPVPPSLGHINRQLIILFYYQRAVNKQTPWKSGPEILHRAKISPGAIGCLGTFPTFSSRYNMQQESWWNRRAVNSPGGTETKLLGVCGGGSGAASPCSRAGSMAGETWDIFGACKAARETQQGWHDGACGHQSPSSPQKMHP